MGQSKKQIQMMTERDKRESLKNKILNILAVILLSIGITASFLHRALDSENPKIALLNQERADLKVFWNKKEEKNDVLFKKDLISKEIFFKTKKQNEIDRIKDFKQISKKRKELAIDFSFNGRSSMHYWLWVFGVFLTTFIISCYLANKDSRLKKAGVLKWYEPFFSISFISVSLFWLYHTIFMINIDFKFTTYVSYLAIIIFPLSYFLYHFIRRSFTIESNLLKNNSLLVSHILKNTKEDKEEEKWNVLEQVSRNGR